MRVPGTGHEASNSFHRETVSFWHLGQSTSASDLRADWPSTPPRSTLIAKLSVSHGLNQVPAEPITTGEMGQLTSAMKNLAGHELIQRMTLSSSSTAYRYADRRGSPHAETAVWPLTQNWKRRGFSGPTLEYCQKGLNCFPVGFLDEPASKRHAGNHRRAAHNDAEKTVLASSVPALSIVNKPTPAAETPSLPGVHPHNLKRGARVRIVWGGGAGKGAAAECAPTACTASCRPRCKSIPTLRPGQFLLARPPAPAPPFLPACPHRTRAPASSRPRPRTRP